MKTEFSKNESGVLRKVFITFCGEAIKVLSLDYFLKEELLSDF